MKMNIKRTVRTVWLLTLAFGLAVSRIAQAQAAEFVWAKLGGYTNLSSGWSSFPSSIDVRQGFIYSLSTSGAFWSYNIQSNLFTQLSVSGTWPARVDQCICNPDEDTIWFTVYGRGQVFRLPATGGAVQVVGASGASAYDFGNTTFWNSVTHRYGAVFGYGYFAVRNWRWEFGTNDTDWVQIEANSPGRQPWTSDSRAAAIDFNGKRLFLYSGEGNSTGGQGYHDPGFFPRGNFDALRDLWILDFQSNQWSNLIPLNGSILIEGQIVYYPPLDMLLMINGLAITNGPYPQVTGLWTFNVEQGTNWTQVVATGDVPSGADEYIRQDSGGGIISTSFYDSWNNRIIHFNNRGVYALSFGPTIGLIKAVKPSLSGLWLGTNYQLQVSSDLNDWTNQGSAFIATNTSMVYPQYWDVDNWSQLFFRLQVSR